MLPPLTVDLNSLYSGNIDGQVGLRTIMDEFNEYFYHSPTLDRSSLGDIADIKLVSRTENTATNNNIFAFDMQLFNNSLDDTEFTITGYSCNDPTVTFNPMPATLNADEYTKTVRLGETIRTAQYIEADFSAPGNGNYTISLDVRVKNADNTVKTGSIDFIVEVADQKILNKRYQATEVSGDIEKVDITTNVRVAKMVIVDEHGNEITNDDQAGFLSIKAAPGYSEEVDKPYSIMVDELDSMETGYQSIRGNAQLGTNRAFSHFFGLNDLFTSDALDTVRGTAYSLAIKDSIASDPNRLSVAKLLRSPDVLDEKQGRKAYGTLQLISNPVAADSLTVNGVNYTFTAAVPTGNQIAIGATISDTINNIVATLNSASSEDVLKAEYHVNPSEDTVDIVYKEVGETGNSFGLEASISGGGSSINDDLRSNNTSGFLRWGEKYEEGRMRNSNTYEISSGAQEVSAAMSSLFSSNTTFGDVEGIGPRQTTFRRYATDILTYSVEVKVNFENTFNNTNIIYGNILKNYQSISTTDINEQLVRSIEITQHRNAALNIITTVNKLNDALFRALS